MLVVLAFKNYTMKIYLHFYKDNINRWKVWGYLPKKKNTNNVGYNVAFAFGIGVLRCEF